MDCSERTRQKKGKTNKQNIPLNIRDHLNFLKEDNITIFRALDWITMQGAQPKSKSKFQTQIDHFPDPK